MAKIELHGEAHREYREAIDWYALKSPRTSRRFVSEVKSFLKLIRQQPDRFAFKDEGFREVILLVFPYSIIYTVERTKIVVFAIANASRDRGYWLDRVNLN